MQYRYDLDRCQSFQSRQINHRIIARHAAHFQLRSQAAADCRTFRLAEQVATKIVRQLHATNTRWLAIRHTGDCRRNRRRGATGAAIGATTQVRHTFAMLSPQVVIRNLFCNSLSILTNCSTARLGLWRTCMKGTILQGIARYKA